MGYDPVPLFSTAEELTFEEMRGRAWLAKNEFRAPAPMTIPAEADHNELDVSMDCADEPAAPTEELDAPSSAGRTPSPTIHTKAAMSEISAMFST